MKYQKKPVVIEAVQYDGDNHDEILAFCPTALWVPAGLYIKTLEGDMHVSDGDFVIRGIAGEFYPCKPDIFAATYLAVVG